jgi:hypothetical protein
VCRLAAGGGQVPLELIARTPAAQRRASITLRDLTLSGDLPVFFVYMLKAIDRLTLSFGQECYHLRGARDGARGSRARSVVYDLTDLKLVGHAQLPRCRRP